MIEIGFNASVTGSLMGARAYNGLFANDDFNEIIQLNFILDIGYIDNEITGKYRMSIPYLMYSFHDYDEDALIEDDTEIEEDSFGTFNNDRWALFNRSLKKCKDVRVWLSDTAEAYCGLLNICEYLERKRVNIYIVECPLYIPWKCKESFLYAWEQTDSKAKVQYISGTRKLSKGEVHIYASRWRELKAENMPLRVLVGKSVIGVPEDYYDIFIRKHIPKGQFKEGQLISDIHDEGIIVHFGWIERRIEKMIENGELKIIKDAKDQYKRMLRKTKDN